MAKKIASSNMRATGKAHEPEYVSVIISISEEKEKEGKWEEWWIKTVKCAQIACFCKKCYKNNEKDTNRNRHDGFGEDNENKNTQCEEEIVTQKPGDTDCAILNDFSCDKVSKMNNENEREEKQEDS